MCGIVGSVGHKNTIEFLLAGLRRLEYRGYDSAGISVIAADGSLASMKTPGRIDALAQLIDDLPESGIGIGHTRWATHGPPVRENAHPHFGGENEVAVVHNGVIENYAALKESLQDRGYRFVSNTDTEVVAHLIADANRQLLAAGEFTENPHDRLAAAVSAAVAQLRGTWGLVAMFPNHEDVLIAARLGSPLVIGVGDGEHFIASDASPLIGFTERIVYLSDRQVAVITADSLRVIHDEQGSVRHSIHAIPNSEAEATLDGYPHFMLKEIYEQPQSLANALRGRLFEEHATAVFGGLNLTPHQSRRINRIILTACGTSWHAALVGEYMLEEIAGIPVEVEYASELRYRNPPLDPDTLLFALTQSGETADTLAAMREMQRKGHHALAICNSVGSTIAQEADGGIYLHAGPEVGVASTKAFTSQLAVLAMLSLYFGRVRQLGYDAGARIMDAIQAIPQKVETALEVDDVMRRIAIKYAHCNNFLYLGRQFNFPTALEGALKLKEISYIHAEGYPAAEMKHGPIALVDSLTPSVFIMPQGRVYEKVMSNLEEVKARGGPVIAVAGEGDTRIGKIADDVVYIPQVDEFLQPMVSVIPLQFLSYHIALLRGCDVDKPRNLAKSVTVE
ncbi:MAG: glutamine--fructose-6-phosphate transaminase (isomerizing) [bacterium]|nr:glutamine--fructose-6-phosphate transaminase (isomerizing) [bacterium]